MNSVTPSFFRLAVHAEHMSIGTEYVDRCTPKRKHKSLTSEKGMQAVPFLSERIRQRAAYI